MTILCVCVFFFLKQKTAYEMRISDWSSDVCSSDLRKVTVAIQSLLCVSVSVCTVRVKRTLATRSLMKEILRTRAWTTAPLPQTTCGLAALFELKNLPQRCCSPGSDNMVTARKFSSAAAGNQLSLALTYCARKNFVTASS